MSFTGNNPKFKWQNFTPQSADPSSPAEGDVFYSDGTPRTEGLWLYQDGAWAQISTGASLNEVAKLRFIPQSSDPAAPTTGTTFYSDGTTRTAGLWVYNGTSWTQVTGVKYQEFFYQD